MLDIRELYQEVILDHNKHPHNCRTMDDANRCAHGNNPLCGDQLTVYLKIEDGYIADVSFEGQGCAISTASASLMTDYLHGKSEQDANALFQRVHQMLIGNSDADDLGKLAVLSGVRDYPARVKCATLAWHTVSAALAKDDEVVSTE